MSIMQEKFYDYRKTNNDEGNLHPAREIINNIGNYNNNNDCTNDSDNKTQ